MENQLKPNLVRKLTVPFIAIILVIGIVIYNGGLENALKFLGIKASQLETITLTTESQMDGSGAETWLVSGSAAEVTGAATFNSSDLVPSDPDGSGFVMPIFSSEDPQQDAYPKHEYISPAMDLGAEAPILVSYGTQAYVPDGTDVRYAYRTASTVTALENGSFSPVEVPTEPGTEISSATATLGVNVERYLQVHVSFQNNTALTRSAVYGWTIQYDPNLPEIDEGTPDTIVLPPTDEQPTDGTNNEVTEDVEEVEETTPVTLDFTEAGELPEKISIQILKITVGSQPILEESNLDTQEVAPLYNLSQPLESGHYVLVVRTGGYEAMVLPFRINQPEPKIIKLEAFVKAPEAAVTFDLNQDGVVNSLDVAILLQQINKQAS